MKPCASFAMIYVKAIECRRDFHYNCHNQQTKTLSAMKRRDKDMDKCKGYFLDESSRRYGLDYKEEQEDEN